MKKLFLLLVALVSFGHVSAQPNEITTGIVPPSVGDIFRDTTGNDRDAGYFEGVLTDHTLPLNEDDTGPQAAAGQYQFRFLVERVLNFVKRMLIPLAMILITLSGVVLLASRTEDEYGKAITNLRMVAVGFGVFTLSVFLVDNVLFGTSGEIFQSTGTSSQFGENLNVQVRGIADFVSTFVVGVATLFIIVRAAQILAGLGSSESVEQAKTHVIWSLVGIFIVVSSRTIYRLVTTGDGRVTFPSINGMIQYIGGWTNFMLSIIVTLSFVSMIYGGFRMVLNFGDQSAMDAARSTVIGGVIGLLVAFGSYTIIAFLTNIF